MVIRETQRTYTYLNLYDYATDAILVNRVFPDEITDPFFTTWKKRQAKNIEFVREAFGSLPLLKAPLFGEEVGGLDTLRRLADELYGDRNPAERLFDGVVHKLEQLDGDSQWMLRVPIGFAEKEQLDLYRSREEITLSVGPYRAISSCQTNCSTWKSPARNSRTNSSTSASRSKSSSTRVASNVSRLSSLSSEITLSVGSFPTGAISSCPTNCSTWRSPARNSVRLTNSQSRRSCKIFDGCSFRII